MSAVDDQLASTSVPIAYLVELDFTTGMQRLTTWNTSIVWGGHTWQGLGALAGISKVASAERPQYPAVDLSLAVGAELFALARGNVETYRGRDATIYRYIMADDYTWIGEPELVWAGEMSQVRIDTGDGTAGTVSLRCEQRGRTQRNGESLRLNAAQHEARWPGDTAFRRKEALVGQPQTWLSKKFQQL